MDNVERHIRAAFEDRPVGTFLTFAQITLAGSNRVDEKFKGLTHPSITAVTVRLNYGVPGIEWGIQDGVKGAFLVVGPAPEHEGK